MDWGFHDTDHAQIWFPVHTVPPGISVLMKNFSTMTERYHSPPPHPSISIMRSASDLLPMFGLENQNPDPFLSIFVSNMLISVLPSSQHRCMLPQTANLLLLARTLIPVCEQCTRPTHPKQIGSAALLPSLSKTSWMHLVKRGWGKRQESHYLSLFIWLLSGCLMFFTAAWGLS